MSGLALGIVVVESGYRSGANLTATIGLEQGKKVYCLPCNVDSKYYGTNDLLLRGVKPVINVKQILDGIGIIASNKGVSRFKIEKPVSKPEIEVPKEYEYVYKVLTKEPKHINEISKTLNESISKITGVLTMLELEGAATGLPGNMFKKEE